MKVILTGATGSIGSGVLTRCLAHPSVTSVVTLTRRPLDVKDDKLESIIHTDFTKYEPSVIERLKGADACIWVLGSPTSGKTVHVDYTMAAVKMLLESVVPKTATGKPFRFVYTSGGAVPMLESNVLFFLGELRKVRVQLDRDVLAVEQQNPGRWESFVVRPWFVVDQPPVTRFIFPGAWIYRETLGEAMLDAAINGGEPRILDNTALNARGKAALEKHKL